ncbi:MAG: glycoside hydrolase family 1 protein [bacterium]|nr:glycoside hydrolase family 1 protein [bacterium]
MDRKNSNQFPPNFFWGVSTSSHQVEGGTKNQWSEWEKKNAKNLATTSHDRLGWLPNWRDVKDEACDPENYISRRGVEHYSRYKKDFEIAKDLNINAFRFGIEWARIQPSEGKWDEKEIEHYRNYIKELRKQGIEPFLNLWHWTHPVWFEEKGGFSKRRNLKYFKQFAQKVADEFAEDLTYIITINEPNVYTSLSYVQGEWPPQKKNWPKSFFVMRNLVKAHRIAYKVFKSVKPGTRIGVAAQLANIQPKNSHNLFDVLMTWYMRFFWNWWYLNRIKRKQDFVGFNYYFTDYYKKFKRSNPTVPVNDLGWYMEPEGLFPLLVRVWKHYNKPIIVTENGVADSDDQFREWWIEETVIAMEKALSEGVHLQGYFHWSLLDNFEWAYGWWPKFGLVEVDRKTMKRKVRPSGRYYAKTIKDIQNRSN